MILFIAPNPAKQKDREGYMQRVAAIDDIFKNEKKIYYDDIAESEDLVDILFEARIIYVHSIYQAERALYLYQLFADKIVTDLHGVVPEEEDFAENPERSLRLGDVEKTVFEQGKTFVAVTHAMVNHYKDKYKNSKHVKWIVLPIFDPKPNYAQKKLDGNEVIYAGGTQKWQNVDLMVNAINKKYHDYKFTILTHDPGGFSGISSKANEQVMVKTVHSSLVNKYYSKATLGFILRDDVTVNKVACPTKLIEYLSYGVVPIVLSPAIGDFNSMGYHYVTLEEFNKSVISESRLEKATKANYKIISKMILLTRRGTEELTNLYKDSKQGNEIDENERITLAILVECSRRLATLEDINQKYELQIARQTEVIAQYANSVNSYKKLIDEVTHSKRWIFVDVAKRPWTAKKYLKHHKN